MSTVFNELKPDLDLVNQLIILGSIQHPNMLKVYELLHDEERFFIVMELIEDCSLQKHLKECWERTGRGLPEANVKSIMMQLLNVVQYLH